MSKELNVSSNYRQNLIIINMYKICSKCKLLKEISEYCKDKNWLNWVRSVCKECGSKWNKDRYKNKKDEIRKIQIEYYYSSNIPKELGRLKRAKRRALINNTSDDTINIISTNNLLHLQNYKCNYCKIDIIDRKTRHLDHIIPLSKWWIHTINNIQWLCCKCNLEKSNKLI